MIWSKSGQGRAYLGRRESVHLIVAGACLWAAGRRRAMSPWLSFPPVPRASDGRFCTPIGSGEQLAHAAGECSSAAKHYAHNKHSHAAAIRFPRCLAGRSERRGIIRGPDSIPGPTAIVSDVDWNDLLASIHGSNYPELMQSGPLLKSSQQGDQACAACLHLTSGSRKTVSGSGSLQDLVLLSSVQGHGCSIPRYLH